MDRVVQQNAASAEESASASGEMKVQAERMKVYVYDLAAVINGASQSSKDSGKRTPSGKSGENNAARKAALPSKAGYKGNGKAGAKALQAGGSKPREVRPEQVIPFEEDEFNNF